MSWESSAALNKGKNQDVLIVAEQVKIVMGISASIAWELERQMLKKSKSEEA